MHRQHGQIGLFSGVKRGKGFGIFYMLRVVFYGVCKVANICACSTCADSFVQWCSTSQRFVHLPHAQIRLFRGDDRTNVLCSYPLCRVACFLVFSVSYVRDADACVALCDFMLLTLDISFSFSCA